MKKMNNKGFSLVELIIVIAIMAILIGVLAPQYLKYVEKSRRSSDLDQLDSCYTAMTTAAADPDLTAVPGGSTTGTLTSGAAGTWTGEVCNTLATTDGRLMWKSNDSGSKGVQAAPTWSTDANVNFTVTMGNLSVKSGQ